MQYKEVSIVCESEALTQIFEAEFMDIGFESFQTDDNVLRAYIKHSEFDAKAVEAILTAYSDSIISSETINHEHQNWNALWESNYPPVRLGDELFIGAPFHQVPTGVKHHIIIDPNMSFGTGHHPTTEMVLRQLFTIELDGKQILDFGCGTGVLAVYCSYKGGTGLAVEIDEHAAKAAQDNLHANKVQNFEVIVGGIETVKEIQYDVIVANINRNVIEECLAHFINNLEAGGQFICSGFLVSDTKALCQLLTEKGLEIIYQDNIGEWSMIACKKPL